MWNKACQAPSVCGTSMRHVLPVQSCLYSPACTVLPVQSCLYSPACYYCFLWVGQDDTQARPHNKLIIWPQRNSRVHGRQSSRSFPQMAQQCSQVLPMHTQPCVSATFHALTDVGEEDGATRMAGGDLQQRRVSQRDHLIAGDQNRM